jgi:ATP-dependent RNA helicase HrpA
VPARGLAIRREPRTRPAKKRFLTQRKGSALPVLVRCCGQNARAPAYQVIVVQQLSISHAAHFAVQLLFCCMDARVGQVKELLPKAMLPDWVRLGSRLVRLLRDRHHPDVHDRILSRLHEQAEASVALRQRRQANLPQITYPIALPITPRKDEIVDAIRRHQVIVIAGETGSGKTTQIPKMCLEAGLGIEAMIGCTQPRRIAALSISRRIAEELNVSWGGEVGCKIRFDDRSSPNTYIKLMTDGILLAETQGDPLLSEYNAIIIDEAHERSLNIDFLLGYLKGLLAKRPELKLIVTSATIDTQAFSKAFSDAPILEVSGRLYPVEVVYSPLDALTEESGELTYIDAAVRAAEQIAMEPGEGDALIFMPSERDIRETRDLLQTRLGDSVELVPLFGRLSASDQQRVFAPAARRKIVIATNIAETSLTIPGIRYVIDSGLARISRYNPRTRTRRLPIEPVAQSSCNQRKGRSGRVQNGICIRLYSEEDFSARPPFTQPEIQRANLAEVILRMKAFGLGEIETFPFINPPAPAAIDGGYRLLQELGALDEKRCLTGLGRDLARLPIDPTLGRMLLQAHHEHATSELLIIAAGLSVQDPRERPLDQKEAASAAHQRFADPRSDFLALLNLWNAVHEQWETLRTQNQRRKFCKAHFLSYLRMREWQDLHAQLQDALEDLGTLRLNESNAAYEAIHRAILAGLLGHVAIRTERNLYRGPGNRRLNVFPGSVLFARGTPQKRGKNAPRLAAADPTKTSQPEWIVAGEVVETSQLFARTLAGIEANWIIELAPHLCKITVDNPLWSPAAGQVLAVEKTFLYGLEVRERKVAYGNIEPKRATEIFIRGALVEENLRPEPPPRPRERDDKKLSSSQLLAEARADAAGTVAPTYSFIEHNRQVRHKIETWQTRMRRHDLVDLDEALFGFYSKHLEAVSSFHELNRWLAEHDQGRTLCATETDLIGDLDLSYDAEAFPDQVRLGGQAVPLAYSYSPGEEHDGVTIKLNTSLAQELSPATVEWVVPGFREATVAELLRSLPKAIRRELMPFPPKVAEIARDLQPGGRSLKEDLARMIHKKYGVEIPASAWPADPLPAHLRPRVEVIGRDQKTVASGRDLAQVRQKLAQAKAEPAKESPQWEDLAQCWERFGLTSWTIEDVPERVTAGQEPELVAAWPGLTLEEGQVHLRLFRSREAARTASVAGIRHLVEMAIQKDLAWLQKDLRGLTRLTPLLAGLCTVDELQAGAFANLKAHLLPSEPFPALQARHFFAAVALARERLPGLAAQMSDSLAAILQARLDILRRVPSARVVAAPRTLSSFQDLGQRTVAPHVSLIEKELGTLLPIDFLTKVPFARLGDLLRYLKALRIRAERAAVNPGKDQERARSVAPYVQALKELGNPKSDAARDALEEFRWMIEEFKVSVFAQELGTAFPISPKRLDEQLRKARAAA